MLRIDWNTFRVAKRFKPDILISVGSPNAAHVSWLLRKPHIAFEDTEHSREQYYLYAPFTTTICTPSCFKKDLGRKQIRFDGHKQLAYLHPNYFRPDPSVLSELGLINGERFVVIRFVSWGASHDIGRHGFVRKREFVERLREHAKVFITSEAEMDDDLERYRLRVSPEKLHSLLYYASLCFGDGGSTAIESALLGTPTVHFEYAKRKNGKYSTTQDLGVFDDLVNKYGLVQTFSDEDEAIQKSLDLIKDQNSKVECQQRTKQVFEHTIDVTAFVVDLIEHYDTAS